MRAFIFVRLTLGLNLAEQCLGLPIKVGTYFRSQRRQRSVGLGLKNPSDKCKRSQRSPYYTDKSLAVNALRWMLLQKKQEGKPFCRRPQVKEVPTVFQQLHVRYREEVVAQRSHLASGAGFNVLVIIMIFLNTVVIGIEMDLTRASDLEERSYWFAIEALFAIFFLVEAILRIHQLGYDYFLDSWNVYDYTLVVLSGADIVVSVTLPGSGGLGVAKSLRILRLLRVYRSIKGLPGLCTRKF